MIIDVRRLTTKSYLPRTAYHNTTWQDNELIVRRFVYQGRHLGKIPKMCMGCVPSHEACGQSVSRLSMLCNLIDCMVPRLASGTLEMNKSMFLILRSQNHKLDPVHIGQRVTNASSSFSRSILSLMRARYTVKPCTR